MNTHAQNPSISVLPSQINHHLYFLFKRFKQNDLHLENLSPRRPPSMQFLACKNNSTTFTTYKEEKIPHYYLLLFFIKLKIVLLVPTTYIFFLFFLTHNYPGPLKANNLISSILIITQLTSSKWSCIYSLRRYLVTKQVCSLSFLFILLKFLLDKGS